MKRYLWTAVAVLFVNVNVNASENPFALKENLLKIDSDQEILLSELGKIAEAREDAELEEDDVEPIAKVLEEVKNTVSEDSPEKMEDSEEQYNLANAIDELVGDYDKEEGVNLAATLEELSEDPEKKGPVLTTTVNEGKKESEAKAEKAAAVVHTAKMWEAKQEELKKVELEKSAQKKAMQLKAQQESDKKAKLAEDARETEKREVEAYEKKRAEKLAKQAESDAKKKAEVKPEAVVNTTKMEKEEQAVDIDLDSEKKAAKETADIGYVNAVKEMDGADKMVTSTPIVEKVVVEKMQTEKSEIVEEDPLKEVTLADGEIDVAAEKRAAKKAADAAYLEAVREMDQED